MQIVAGRYKVTSLSAGTAL